MSPRWAPVASCLSKRFSKISRWVWPKILPNFCCSDNTLDTWCKKQHIGKDAETGKDWRQESKGTTDDEMVGWCHWLNGHEFEQILGDSEGQESLACCISWCCKNSDMTEQLTENNSFLIAASSMGPTVCKILCVLCQSGVYFSQPLASPKNKLSGLQTQTFWGLIFQ